MFHAVCGELSVAGRAIAAMRSPTDMHIICVDITNRCDLRCSNCTRLLVNQKNLWDMSADHFRAALRSLEGFPGVIAMIGGNPCLHKEFPDLCQVFVDEIAEKRQRRLWSNNVFDHQDLISETFGFFNLNPHNDRRGLLSLDTCGTQLPRATSTSIGRPRSSKTTASSAPISARSRRRLISRVAAIMAHP